MTATNFPNGVRAPILNASGATAGAIANPTGGATTDAEARAAIVAILTALRAAQIIDT